MAGNSGPGALGKMSPAPNNYVRGKLYMMPFGYASNPNFSPILFLMNPESITESLVGGWVHKAVPGQNDPISSWVSNGTRTVSLSLLLNKDISDFNVSTVPNVAKGTSNTTPTLLGNLGAAFSGIGTKVLQNIIPKQIINFTPGSSADVSSFNGQTAIPKSISAEVTQIKSLRYGDKSRHGYSIPPALVKFQFYLVDTGDTLGSVSNPTLGTSISGLDDAYWTVDAIEIIYSKWDNALNPLEAEVKLTLVQFNDINITKSQILGNTTPSSSGGSGA